MEDYLEQRVKTKVGKYVTIAFKVFFGIIVAIAFALLLGYGIMWLWNWLMPELFGLAVIGYWQAVGILVLSRLLVGGIGGGDSKDGKGKSRKHVRNRFRARCNGDFSKWKHYDKFWEEEGEQAYEAYLEKMHKKED